MLSNRKRLTLPKMSRELFQVKRRISETNKPCGPLNSAIGTVRQTKRGIASRNQIVPDHIIIPSNMVFNTASPATPHRRLHHCLRCGRIIPSHYRVLDQSRPSTVTTVVLRNCKHQEFISNALFSIYVTAIKPSSARLHKHQADCSSCQPDQ